jgi:hypothetical protein
MQEQGWRQGNKFGFNGLDYERSDHEGFVKAHPLGVSSHGSALAGQIFKSWDN